MKKEKLLTRKEKLKIKAQASAKKYKQELKKSINTAMVAAFGFLIALSWKELITEYVELIAVKSPVKGQLISTLIVTFICVGGILLVTRFFSEES